MRDPTKQQQRAQRLLEAAAQLLLRWGYQRVTIEEIARHAHVATGTVYLHWKTKEAIFETVLLREMAALWREMLHRIQTDPQQALVHCVMRSLFLLIRTRPLATALFTQDRDLLGHLSFGLSMPVPMQGQEFIKQLRQFGLVRTDCTNEAQTYAFTATVSGFVLLDPAQTQVSLEEKAQALAQTIRLAFEPETLPASTFLQEQVVPWWTRLLEQACEFCEEQIQERMT